MYNMYARHLHANSCVQHSTHTHSSRINTRKTCRQLLPVHPLHNQRISVTELRLNKHVNPQHPSSKQFTQHTQSLYTAPPVHLRHNQSSSVTELRPQQHTHQFLFVCTQLLPVHPLHVLS